METRRALRTTQRFPVVITLCLSTCGSRGQRRSEEGASGLDQAAGGTVPSSSLRIASRSKSAASLRIFAAVIWSLTLAAQPRIAAAQSRRSVGVAIAYCSLCFSQPRPLRITVAVRKASPVRIPILWSGETALTLSRITSAPPTRRDMRRSRAMNTMDAIATEQVTVQEQIVGAVRWIAIRARGAEWSWLTPDEAAKLGSDWSKRYGNT
jgi:hypothetical protein